MKVRTRRPRKLLSASLGVAAVSYVACGGSSSTVANLVAPPPVDGAAGNTGGGPGNPRDAASGAGGAGGTVGNPFDVVANLVVAPVDAGPDQVNDAPSDATDATRDAPPSFFDVVANLVVAPRDANSDVTSDTTDSGGSPLDVVANLVIAPLDSGQ